LDDVLTSGKTLLKTGIVALKREGFKIGMILVVVDRQEGGKEFLAKSGYDNVHTIFTRSELLAMK